jgi:hypothetical protein
MAYDRTDRANGGDYPRQIVIMVDVETADRIEAEGGKRGKSKVARDYLLAGMRRKDVLERAKPGTRHPDHIEFQAPAPPAATLQGPAD